jgi:hypothetical protein
MGDRCAPGTSDAGNTWTEKLKGNYELPFSIKILDFAESPDGEERFRLPHTFTDRASWGSIEYYLELRISRGKLRSDDRYAGFCVFLHRAEESELQDKCIVQAIHLAPPKPSFSDAAACVPHQRPYPWSAFRSQWLAGLGAGTGHGEII